MVQKSKPLLTAYYIYTAAVYSAFAPKGRLLAAPISTNFGTDGAIRCAQFCADRWKGVGLRPQNREKNAL